MTNLGGQLLFLSDIPVPQIALGIFILAGVIVLLIFVIKRAIAPQKKASLLNAYKRGNYKQVIKSGQELLQKDGMDPEVHYIMGEAYYELTRFHEALSEYILTTNREMTSHIIKFTHLHERLAELYLKEKNLEEAAKEYVELRQKDPNNFDYCYALAEISEKRGKYDVAAKYYLASIKLKPTNLNALVSLGVIFTVGKRYQDADKLLSKANRMDPTNPKAQYYLALCKKATEHLDEAMKLFEYASRDKEFKVKSLIERGRILMTKGKNEDASVEFQRALKNLDNNLANKNTIINVRYVLAECYESVRDITNTVAQLEEISKLNPMFKDVQARLATYASIRMGDGMKDFMTAADDAFLNICKEVVSTKMNMSINDIEIIKKDVVQIVATDNEMRWMNAKRQPKLIRIYRINTPVTERELHDTLDVAKTKGAINTIVLSASSFSKTALSFSQERPLTLIDKTALATMVSDAK